MNGTVGVACGQRRGGAGMWWWVSVAWASSLECISNDEVGLRYEEVHYDGGPVPYAGMELQRTRWTLKGADLFVATVLAGPPAPPESRLPPTIFDLAWEWDEMSRREIAVSESGGLQFAETEVFVKLWAPSGRELTWARRPIQMRCSARSSRYPLP